MKILIATDTYYLGAGNVPHFTQRRLAMMLVEQGHQVFVMAPSPNTKKIILEHDGVTVYGLSSFSLPAYPNLRISPLFFSKTYIKKCLEEINPDIIHVQDHFMIGRGVLKIAKELDIPVVGTNHFMPENFTHYFYLPKFIEAKFKKIIWQGVLKVYNQVETMISPTKTAGSLLEKSGFKNMIIPVSNGIDLKRFNLNNNGDYLKEKYKIPANRLSVLYVGRLDKEKRIDMIIAAMPEIIKKVDAHLVLGGVGKLRYSLEEQVKNLGLQDRVTFVGFVPDEDLPNLYRLANLFAIAGIAELQSVVTMEAMASGLPILGVNAVALPELIHDGENGYLFSENNIQELAERAIMILLNKELQAQMSAKSLEIIQRHDVNLVMAKHESIYQTTIVQHQSYCRQNVFLKKYFWTLKRLAVLAIFIFFGLSSSFTAVVFAKDYKKIDNLRISSKHFASNIYTKILKDDDDSK